MTQWQQYPGRSNENSEYAVVNDRKAEIIKGEHGRIFVELYKKMLPPSPGGTPWWSPVGGRLRLMNYQAAKEYAEQWLTGGQEG